MGKLTSLRRSFKTTVKLVTSTTTSRFKQTFSLTFTINGKLICFVERLICVQERVVLNQL